MKQKSTQYVLAEKTGNLLAEKNTKIEEQAARIAELESALTETQEQLFQFLAKVADEDNPMEFTKGGLAIIRTTRQDWEIMHAKLIQIDGERKRNLLAKVQS